MAKPPPVFGICRLCLQYRELKRSHTLSALVYRWLRRTQRRQNRPFIMLNSVEGTHKPVQDGIKVPLCCWECEQALGVDEREFRNRFFGPYVSGETTNRPYGSWLLRFATANAWRVLQYHLEETPKTPWEPSLRSESKRAAERWRQFLHREVSGLGEFRVHLVKLSTDFAPQDYIHHVTHSEVVEFTPTGDRFVFVKFASLFVVATIYDSDPRQWRHSALEVRGGVWNQHDKFRIHHAIGGYIASEARKLREFAAKNQTGALGAT